MSQGDLNHVSVIANDLGRSLAFYEELFGLERIPTPNFGFPVQWLRAGERQLHLFERPGDAPVYAHLALGVANEDVPRIYELARERSCFDETTFGAHLIELPNDLVQLYLRDPSGNLVEVNAHGASRLPEELRSVMVPLRDRFPQTAENEQGTLYLSVR